MTTQGSLQVQGHAEPFTSGVERAPFGASQGMAICVHLRVSAYVGWRLHVWFQETGQIRTRRKITVNFSPVLFGCCKSFFSLK